MMNDNEIIKALECCTKPTTDCNNCSAYKLYGVECFDIVKKEAINLINRLKAENKRLERELALAETISRARHNKIEKLSEKVVASIAEIEERDAMLTQQAEIIKRLEQSAKEKADEIERLEYEIDRQGHILNSYALQYGTTVDKDRLLKEAKAEAVREFAERIKGLLAININVSNMDYADIANDIDNLLEEMYGKVDETS